MVIRINDPQNEKLLMKWGDVFKSNNPFGNPFKKGWQVIFFYPTYGYHLEEHHFNALMAAIAQGSDEEVFVLESEFEANLSEHARGWRMRSDASYLDYHNIGVSVENSLWSPSCTWGLMISHELHAIVGGEPEFMSHLLLHSPFAKQEQEALFQFWAENADDEWLHQVVDANGIL